MDLALGRIRRYEEQVYAAVLGKIVGVYLGRPFEGWHKSAIEARWGFVDRYVHEDVDKPLVVSDDDISGTLTFVRALEDSGSYAETPADFFGDTWLNYLMEERTILWWGGRGMSTEHTAYLNLKEGVRAPESGSIARNGCTVAEQIGAQIFIDAFGMVAPGRPALAADLARRAAGVSHDGEAVHAACVVAAMVSAAFAEKRMGRLLDIGAGVIPERSLIARLHRDVRSWARRDRDWRRTWERIDRKYGYHKYGGNCHVVPNHAVMVMAWAYAPADFRRCLGICATAGWDTDCNVGNVGSVAGLVAGLDGINREYEFQAPFADRLILPTAEGSRGVSDVLSEALRIAAMGRRLAGQEPAEARRGGVATRRRRVAEATRQRRVAVVQATRQSRVVHHFSLPGALHGYLPEEGDFETRGTARVSSVASPARDVGPCLCIDYAGLKGDRVGRISTPMLPGEAGARYGGAAQVQACPRLYSGMTVALEGLSDRDLAGAAAARLFVRHFAADGTPSALASGPLRRLQPGKALRLSLKVPDTGGWPVKDLGVEIRGEGLPRSPGQSRSRRHEPASGRLYVHAVRLSGRPRLSFPVPACMARSGGVAGWVCDADAVRNHPFSDDAEPVVRLQKNQGRGVMVTGTDDWTDYTLSSRVNVHLAAAAGLIVRYQGLQRYLALIQNGGHLALVERYYRDTVLGQVRARWQVDELHALKVVCRGRRVRAYCDGNLVAEAQDQRLGRGGAGYLVESGLAGFRDTLIT